MTDLDTARARRREPVMTATLHIGANHVSATDLTDLHREMTSANSDLVSLTLGADNVRVVLLGSLAMLQAILQAGSDHLNRIGDSRPT